jgi:rhodanese-related sulfurtransferase
MDEVFTPENLARLADTRVLVVCQGGVRAAAVAMALRHTGLDDVWILNGGASALAEALTPKTAY